MTTINGKKVPSQFRNYKIISKFETKEKNLIVKNFTDQWFDNYLDTVSDRGKVFSIKTLEVESKKQLTLENSDGNQVSISPTFYEQLLHAQILKEQKRQ